MAQQPNYVAKHSAWEAVTFWRVVLFFLIIPLIVMIVDIFVKKNDVIEFYDDHIIHRKGILSKTENRSVFTGVFNVSISQSLWQRICGFGDLSVDAPGKWDINTKGIANPNGLKNYLESKFVKPSQTTNVFTN